MLRGLLGVRLVQDALVLYGVQIFGYVLPLLTLPYLARVLGPANFGLIALGTALAQYFLVVVEYGFSVTGARRVALADGDMVRVARVYSTIMACKTALLAAGFVVQTGAVAAIPKLRVHWELYLVSYLWVAGWALTPTWLFQGLQRMRLVAWSDYGAKLISVGLIFVLVRRPEDYLIAAAIQSGAFLMSAAIGLGLMFFKVRLRPVWPRRADMREALVEGWPVFLSMASITAMNSTNTMILGMTSTPEQVGLLNGAGRLVVTVRALTNPITNVVYPHMSRLAGKSPVEAIRFFERKLLWTAIPFLFVSLGMLALAPQVVGLLYGPQFGETATLLRLMSPTPLVHFIATCFSTCYMLAFGHEKAWSVAIRRMLALNFMVLLPLMAVMRPARAVALTTALMDVYVATFCILFYLRTERVRRRAAQEVPSL